MDELMDQDVYAQRFVSLSAITVDTLLEKRMGSL